MARSIHTTWTELRRVRRRTDLSEPERRERLAELRDDLRRKRLIKRQVREERRRPTLPLEHAPLGADALVIRVAQPHKSIVYGASAEDLRAVVDRLPAGAIAGVREVVFELGVETMQPVGEDLGEPEVDPVFGRRSWERTPGVFTPPILGMYQPDSARIRLFGAVVPDALPSPRLTEMLLRIQTLATFVHEVAHHQDHQMRVGRGRWLADDTVKVERYAEAFEARWRHDAVIPAVVERHGRACRELMAWLEAELGVAVPLSDWLDDPQTTSRDGLQRMTFGGVHAGLFEFITHSERGETMAARLEFAREVHYADEFGLALRVVDHALTLKPGHVEARALRGDLLEHLERREEAEAVLLGVLDEVPDHGSALYTLGLVYRGASRWDDLADTCRRQLATEDPARRDRITRWSLCIALLHLRDWESLDDAVADLEQGGAPFGLGDSITSPLFLRAAAAFAQGDPARAAALIESLPSGTRLTYAMRRLLGPLRFLVGRALATEAPRPDDASFVLQQWGFQAWIPLLAEPGPSSESVV